MSEEKDLDLTAMAKEVGMSSGEFLKQVVACLIVATENSLEEGHDTLTINATMEEDKWTIVLTKEV